MKTLAQKRDQYAAQVAQAPDTIRDYLALAPSLLPHLQPLGRLQITNARVHHDGTFALYALGTTEAHDLLQDNGWWYSQVPDRNGTSRWRTGDTTHAIPLCVVLLDPGRLRQQGLTAYHRLEGVLK